jgi:arginine-tRNA-protein transferase
MLYFDRTGRPLPERAEETGNEAGRAMSREVPLGGVLSHLYATAPQPCPYLPEQRERKLFTPLRGPQALAQYGDLVKAGFRRSHTIAYRPACRTCRACVPLRVRVNDFGPNRSLRRVIKANADLTAVAQPLTARAEHHALFLRYLRARHHDGEMASMDFDDYRAMVEESCVDTALVAFHDTTEALVAVCLYDRVNDGFSGVYMFFDPARQRQSPGTYMILWLIEHLRALDLPYLYLGYWIEGCRNMAYKARFRPTEALGPDGWQPLEA